MVFPPKKESSFNMIFIVGGQRSGKSRKALDLSCAFRDKAFLATAPRVDEEFSRRIDRHIEERRKENWINYEEQVDLKAFLQKDHECLVLDCVTLWVNNLIFHEKINSEDEVVALLEKEFETINIKNLIIISNEVGLGGISANGEMRKFADILGRANQWLAQKSDEVYLMTCGIAQKIKSP